MPRLNFNPFSHLLLLTLLASAGCRSTPAEPESSPPAPAPTPEAKAAPSVSASAAADGEPAGASSGVRPSGSTAFASPSPSASATPGATGKPVAIPKGHRKVIAKPVAEVPVSPTDPLKGKFSLTDATADIPGKGKLMAEIRTDLGKLDCELFEEKAPLTVANFVGLARGLRPFKSPKGEWVKTPGYDGTQFHRIIKGFMIQGGDPAGTGAGEPGYVVPDEVWEDAYHSERGLICMANRGPNTNGMQFFILDGSAPHLDSGYTIFGKCGPNSVIEKIADSEVQGDKALKPPKIQKVTIRRSPKR